MSSEVKHARGTSTLLPHLTLSIRKNFMILFFTYIFYTSALTPWVYTSASRWGWSVHFPLFFCQSHLGTRVASHFRIPPEGGDRPLSRVIKNIIKWVQKPLFFPLRARRTIVKFELHPSTPQGYRPVSQSQQMSLVKPNLRRKLSQENFIVPNFFVTSSLQGEEVSAKKVNHPPR